MKPRKNYRSRPKKVGAKKIQRVNAQKRRLVAAGHKEEDLKHNTTVEIRDLLKETAKKQAKAARVAKVTKITKPVKAAKETKAAKTTKTATKA